MVGDAVEQRAGEALAGEDRRPFLERQVRCHDCGAVFVAPAEDVEHEFASGLRQGHVAELVDPGRSARVRVESSIASTRPCRPSRAHAGDNSGSPSRARCRRGRHGSVRWRWAACLTPDLAARRGRPVRLLTGMQCRAAGVAITVVFQDYQSQISRRHGPHPYGGDPHAGTK